MTEHGFVGGLALSHGTIRYADFPDRVEAAAAAGCTSIGLTANAFTELLERRWTELQMGRLLEEFGLALGEAELIAGFWCPPGPAEIPERPGLIYADPRAELVLFRMADSLGLRVMQVIGTFDSRELDERVPEAFAALCDRADAHGLTVALEFVPYTSIPSLAMALDVVEEADRRNGGLCIDTWHLFRGGDSVADLAHVPTERIAMVQVNDGALAPSPAGPTVDAVTLRRCPGEGEFPLEAFLDALRARELSIPLSMEVFSTDLQRLPARVAAERVCAAIRHLLSETAAGRVP